MTSPCFLFAGGGSGGHLFPGLAVAEELRRRWPDCAIHFAGPDRVVDRKILGGTAYPHTCLPLQSPAECRRTPLQFFATLWKGGRQAIELIREMQPTVVIGLGGFASVPLALAAVQQGIPLVLLEQNVLPGRATYWLSRAATVVCASFANSFDHLPRSVRGVVTGNPVRVPSTAPAVTATLPTLLILGGSYGARNVNRMALDALPGLRRELRDWRIIHQTGDAERDAVRAEYAAAGITATVEAFLPNLPELLPTATVVISRAGATTLAEMACLGCACILIPLPRAAQDHQRFNALYYATADAARLVEEGPDDAVRLQAELAALMTDRQTVGRLSQNIRQLATPEAARHVADLLSHFHPADSEPLPDQASDPSAASIERDAA